jgi:hypothetical protein
MGYGINEPNDSVAQGLAQDVAAGILSESVVALQGQAHLVGDRVAWLFNTPLRSPRFMN